MSDVAANGNAGSVVSLWRYPVKSMIGEELNAVAFGKRGVVGDRAYAIVDPETGKVASAKNPKKWPHMFDCRAAFVEPPIAGEGPPAVLVTLPDGRVTRSDRADFDSAMSAMLGRPGKLQAAVPEKPVLEEYWPDIEGLDLRDTVTDEDLPAGTFFDLAMVHLLTTATLDCLRGSYPAGRFEARRFRPNVVVATDSGEAAFVENDWLDRTLTIGPDVALKITSLCPRCVMTTLPQGDLPRDPGILRAAAQSNKAHVGVYAEVVRGGSVRRGDVVALL
jgi:MOSC domain-containing protein